MAFQIEVDNIAQPGEKSREGQVYGERPLYGMERVLGHLFADPELPDLGEDGPWVRFRLRDEDNEVHYEGTLHDDPDLLNQQAAQRFGEADTGAWIIEVERDGEWRQEVA